MIWFDFEGLRLRSESVDVLRTLIDRQMTFQQLTNARNTTKGALHCTVMRLLDRGMLVRVKPPGCIDGDRRRHSFALSLTERGRRLISAFDAHVASLVVDCDVLVAHARATQPASVFALAALAL